MSSDMWKICNFSNSPRFFSCYIMSKLQYHHLNQIQVFRLGFLELVNLWKKKPEKKKDKLFAMSPHTLNL
jgi:hypothetical protein